MTVLYTGPTNVQAIIKQIRFVNTDTATRQISWFRNGTATNNTLGKRYLNPVGQNGDTYIDPYVILLQTGDTIEATGDLAQIAYHIFGLETTT